jgi:hypothetical protein
MIGQGIAYSLDAAVPWPSAIGAPRRAKAVHGNRIWCHNLDAEYWIGTLLPRDRWHIQFEWEPVQTECGVLIHSACRGGSCCEDFTEPLRSGADLVDFYVSDTNARDDGDGDFAQVQSYRCV